MMFFHDFEEDPALYLAKRAEAERAKLETPTLQVEFEVLPPVRLTPIPEVVKVHYDRVPRWHAKILDFFLLVMAGGALLAVFAGGIHRVWQFAVEALRGTHL